jgi:ubiquinone/menaquinone biosynthesis C-methylase UbiE
MDIDTQLKWDKASRTLDFVSFAEDRRLGPHKRRLFSKMSGATLMAAAGTGNDFKYFAPGMHVVAIDISPKMLERATRKTAEYQGSIELREMDICDLDFADETFDTVATACTFCSVAKADRRPARASPGVEAWRTDPHVRARPQRYRAAGNPHGSHDAVV